MERFYQYQANIFSIYPYSELTWSSDVLIAISALTNEREAQTGLTNSLRTWKERFQQIYLRVVIPQNRTREDLLSIQPSPRHRQKIRDCNLCGPTILKQANLLDKLHHRLHQGRYFHGPTKVKARVLSFRRVLVAFWEAYGEIQVGSFWIQGLEGWIVGTYTANCLWSRRAKNQSGNISVYGFVLARESDKYRRIGHGEREPGPEIRDRDQRV